MKYPVSIISLFVAVSAFADPVAEFLDRFAAERNEIRQLTATYRQVTITPDETYELTGSIVYAKVRPGAESIEARRLIFRYEDPPLAYMIDGLRVFEYDPEISQLQIFDLENRPEAEAFYLGFGSNTQRLLDAYDLRLEPPASDNPGGTTVTLFPKEPGSDSAFFERVILHLRADDFMPQRIHIVNDIESEVVYHIAEVATADTVDPIATTVLVEAGTNVVQNEAFMGAVPEGGLRFPASMDGDDSQAR